MQQEERDNDFEDEDASEDDADDEPQLPAWRYDFEWIAEGSAEWWDDAGSAQWWERIDMSAGCQNDLHLEGYCMGFSAVPPHSWRRIAKSSLAKARALWLDADAALVAARVQQAFEARAERKRRTGTGNCFACRVHPAACTCVPS